MHIAHAISFVDVIHTGKSFSEALIFASINPQYDNRLFMELPLSYCGLIDAKIRASEKDLHVLQTQYHNNSVVSES